MLTFGEVKADVGMRKIIPACPDSPEFADYVNTGTRVLLRRGDFFETAFPIFVCVFGGCVVWPRYVGGVRRMNICNQPMQVVNGWYSFMSGVNSGCGQWRHWMGQQCGLHQSGTSPVLQDVMGEGRLIRAYTRCNADYGKTITIFGTDNNGQALQHKNNDWNWVPGWVLTLQAPFASTTDYVRHIDYVIRDVTQCPTDVYAYNAATNLLEDIAHYEPTETVPSYSKTKLDINWPNTVTGCGSPPSCCGTRRGVLAMVKLRFIPVVADTDLVLVPNIDALKYAVKSQLANEKGDVSLTRAYLAEAIEELNRDLENNSPDDQFSAIENVFGGATFSNQCF